MDIMNLPKNMRDKIIKLSSTHAIPLEEAQKLFAMANGNYEHASLLCEMKSKNVPIEEIIEMNEAFWKEKKEKFMNPA